jgi:hypothetical protein
VLPRVGIESRKAFAFIIAAQVVLMALAVGVFLRGEEPKRTFPSPVPTVAPAAGTVFVPVSYTRAGAMGRTRTAGFARGGRTARARRASSESSATAAKRLLAPHRRAD